MIYSNDQSVIFPTRTPIGDHVIYLGMEGPIKVEIPCTRDTIIHHGLNRDLNVEVSRKSIAIRDYVEDWRDPQDPRWHIPTELFLFLKGYKSSAMVLGHTVFQAYKKKEQKQDRSPLQRLMRWQAMNPKERTFSIGGIYRVPIDTFSIVRIMYSGMAKVSARYLISFDGSQIHEYSEGSSSLLEALETLKISPKELTPNWSEKWYAL